MSLNVKTLEAKDIQSNQMTFCGELTDLGEHELALCYFEYSKNKDMSDAVNSTRCALLDRPGVYEFIQDNLDDNSNYYFRAAVQNFEETETQIEYLKNIVFFDWCDIEYFNNLRTMDSIAKNSESLTTLLSCKNAVYNVFSSNNLGVLWTGDIKEIGKDYVNVYRSSTGSSTISLVKPIDLTPYKTLYIDWWNVASDSTNNKSYLKINNKTALLKESNFARTIDSIDINSINGTFNIDIVAECRVRSYFSSIYIYSLWLE